MNRPQQQKPEKESNGLIYALGGLALGVIGTLIGKKVVDEMNEEQKVQKQQQQGGQAPWPTQYQTTQGQEQIYETLSCPITGELITDAAQINICGHTFERSALEQWLAKSPCCPQCRAPASKANIIKNYSLQQVIDCQRQKQ